MEQILEKIGLTKNEVKIYLKLLELGLTTSGAIIKKTGIHNSKVYDGLERLANKGLVTHVIISNIKNFKAVSPDRLLDFLEDKKNNINKDPHLKNNLYFSGIFANKSSNPIAANKSTSEKGYIIKRLGSLSTLGIVKCVIVSNNDTNLSSTTEIDSNAIIPAGIINM